jgi:carbon starvation protein CstA
METINGEIITGIALIFLAILFLYASTVNEVWALIQPADFLILAIGVGFLTLGIVTLKKQKQTVGHSG